MAATTWFSRSPGDGLPHSMVREDGAYLRMAVRNRPGKVDVR